MTDTERLMEIGRGEYPHFLKAGEKVGLPNRACFRLSGVESYAETYAELIGTHPMSERFLELHQSLQVRLGVDAAAESLYHRILRKGRRKLSLSDYGSYVEVLKGVKPAEQLSGSAKWYYDEVYFPWAQELCGEDQDLWDDYNECTWIGTEAASNYVAARGMKEF